MFHDIPQAIFDQMRYLEEVDQRDRASDAPREQRLRQVAPETGRFIAFMASTVPQGAWLEIGTSAGYSTLWLALACRERWKKVTTFESDRGKFRMAEETFRIAGVADCVEQVWADARQHLPEYEYVSFCFLDAEKEVYRDCYDMVVPNLVNGGLLLADNALSHEAQLRPLIEFAHNDPRVDAMVVPVGKGVLACRRL